MSIKPQCSSMSMFALYSLEVLFLGMFVSNLPL